MREPCAGAELKLSSVWIGLVAVIARLAGAGTRETASGSGLDLAEIDEY